MTDGSRDPGWYPDPWGAVGEQRYYDGHAWQRNETVAVEPSRSGRRRRQWRPVVVTVAVIAAISGAVAAGWLRSDPTSPAVHRLLHPATDRPKSKGSLKVGQITGRSYGRGDCVTWPQDGQALVDSTVVDCAKPHLIEIVAPVELTGMHGAYPTLEGWQLIDASQCGPVVEKYLGGPIDPYGKYYAGSISPIKDGWDQGERNIWCGISAAGGDAAAASVLPPILGRVQAQQQERVVAPGTCIGGPSVPEGVEVNCALPHLLEVTGTVDLSGQGLGSPTVDAIRNAAEQSCGHVAAAFLGRSLPSDLASDSLSLAPESWAAGSRLVECVVGRISGSGWVPASGSMKAGT